ncbi:hypothetical protein MTR_2g061390 [Medicago truncatula]|uniref:RNase H type-1 domain-containing protein n=1 Tax=Medicago truncatula TaxID=3880 RepID=A0A072V948_MEDTR|nr:hypothetical protein MTR_2g061390 [Medicago truncatula]
MSWGFFLIVHVFKGIHFPDVVSKSLSEEFEGLHGYVPFRKWLEENIIDVDEDIIVHVLALCYEIWCARNKKCFEGADVDVTTTVQKAQRSIMNFKSVSTVLMETLSGGPVLPISNVHWTPPPFSGFYKLDVDAAGPIEGDEWGIGVVLRDNEGVVVGVGSWQVSSLPDSEVI